MNKKIVPCLALLSLSLTAGCNCEKNNNKDNTQQIQGTNNMDSKRKTTSSGLQYEITEESKDATAKKPETGNTVTVHYTGWLANEDGTPNMNKKFDSSVDRNQPFQFVIGIGRVIKGWDEGVKDMKVGEKRRLIIPANLAYGSGGIGSIPANATLIFDVELIAVK